ncbi:hypothetical protein [Streptomyces sp. 7N604]
MEAPVQLVLFDVNETLSDLAPLRTRISRPTPGLSAFAAEVSRA